METSKECISIQPLNDDDSCQSSTEKALLKKASNISHTIGRNGRSFSSNASICYFLEKNNNWCIRCYSSSYSGSFIEIIYYKIIISVKALVNILRKETGGLLSGLRKTSDVAMGGGVRGALRPQCLCSFLKSWS